MEYEYKRALFKDLDQWLAQGWQPAVVRDGAIGVDVFAGGTVEAVLLVRAVVGTASGFSYLHPD